MRCFSSSRCARRSWSACTYGLGHRLGAPTAGDDRGRPRRVQSDVSLFRDGADERHAGGWALVARFLRHARDDASLGLADRPGRCRGGARAAQSRLPESPSSDCGTASLTRRPGHRAGDSARFACWRLPAGPHRRSSSFRWSTTTCTDRRSRQAMARSTACSNGRTSEPTYRAIFSWFTETQTAWPLLGAVALACSGAAALAVGCGPAARRAARCFGAFALWFHYFVYLAFEDWLFLRFVLPSWPLLMLGFAALICGLVHGPGRGRRSWGRRRRSCSARTRSGSRATAGAFGSGFAIVNGWRSRELSRPSTPRAERLLHDAAQRQPAVLRRPADAALRPARPSTGWTAASSGCGPGVSRRTRSSTSGKCLSSAGGFPARLSTRQLETPLWEFRGRRTVYVYDLSRDLVAPPEPVDRSDVFSRMHRCDPAVPLTVPSFGPR